MLRADPTNPLWGLIEKGLVEKCGADPKSRDFENQVQNTFASFYNSPGFRNLAAKFTERSSFIGRHVAMAGIIFGLENLGARGFTFDMGAHPADRVVTSHYEEFMPEQQRLFNEWLSQQSQCKDDQGPKGPRIPVEVPAPVSEPTAMPVAAKTLIEGLAIAGGTAVLVAAGASYLNSGTRKFAPTFARAGVILLAIGGVSLSTNLFGSSNPA